MLDLFIVRYTGIPHRVIRRIEKSDDFKDAGDQAFTDWLIRHNANGMTGNLRMLFQPQTMHERSLRRKSFLSLIKESENPAEVIATLLLIDVEYDAIRDLDGARMLAEWMRGVPARMVADIVRNDLDKELVDSMNITMESRRTPFAMLMRKGLA